MSKYGNTITEVDGIRFHSAAEARRYRELKLLEKGGAIEGLKLQPRYPIVVNNVKICTYVGDFLYLDRERGMTVLEDVKGAKTPVYRLKRSLVKAVWGIDITEVAA